MMRASLASMAMLVACAALASAAPAAGASTRPGARASRTIRLSVSPLPGDLALLELHFRRAGFRALTGRSLHIAVSGAFGDDYLAAARPLVRVHGGPRLLIVILNRPSPLEDPASVRLLVRSARALGRASIYSFGNPFTHPRLAGPALCGLQLPAGPSGGGGFLRPFETRGAALAGFAPIEAVSSAYDVACGLEYDGAFRQAITESPAAPVTPQPPSPAPPAPQPPGCTPCDPPPGSACPLDSRPNICVAAFVRGGQRLSAAGH